MGPGLPERQPNTGAAAASRLSPRNGQSASHRMTEAAVPAQQASNRQFGNAALRNPPPKFHEDATARPFESRVPVHQPAPPQFAPAMDPLMTPLACDEPAEPQRLHRAPSPDPLMIELADHATPLSASGLLALDEDSTLHDTAASPDTRSLESVPADVNPQAHARKGSRTPSSPTTLSTTASLSAHASALLRMNPEASSPGQLPLAALELQNPLDAGTLQTTLGFSEPGHEELYGLQALMAEAPSKSKGETAS